MKEDNKFGKGAKLGLGFFSLCSVCGSILGAFWLTNKLENVGKEKTSSITTSIEDLKTEYAGLKGVWEEYKKKYESLITSSGGINSKVEQLKKTIESLNRNIDSLKNSHSSKK